MKKTIEIITCDDCHTKLKNRDYSYSFILANNKYNKDKKEKQETDLCKQCMTDRINHSFALVRDRTCIHCKGAGNYKEYYGYHNDSDLVLCKHCGGRGVIELYYE